MTNRQGEPCEAQRTDTAILRRATELGISFADAAAALLAVTAAGLRASQSMTRFRDTWESDLSWFDAPLEATLAEIAGLAE